MFSGIKSVIYPSDNLEKDKAHWTAVLGFEPYFDKPYYVGFSVNGTELGLDPNAKSEGLAYPISYWFVENANEATDILLNAGSTMNTEIKDVGGIFMGTFKETSGNIFGIIEHQNEKS